MKSGDIRTPTCPFCGATWTASMLDLLDRHSGGLACTCCAEVPRMDAAPRPVMPGQDLCCQSCGKPIYRAPATRPGT